MAFNEREEKILNILYERNKIRNNELAKLLYVSISTLRRDLEKLEEKGLIVKNHGICSLSEKLRDERSQFNLREQEHSVAKIKIAKEAIKLIRDGEVIMIDASSTVYNMIHFLDKFKNLLVITNSAKASIELAAMSIKNICVGGCMVNKSLSYVGQQAIENIRQYNADMVFFSCKGITPDGYLTDTFLEENDIRKEMIRQAKRKVVLCDSSKIGKRYVYNLCHVSEVDDIICEDALPDYISKYLE